MTPGGYISTAGHIGLIGWLIFGGGFATDPLPEFDVTEVSVISEAQFAALLDPPAPVVDPVTPAALPEPDALDDPVPPAPVVPVTPPPAPAETEPPATETPPDVSNIAPLPDTVVEDTPPTPPVDPVVVIPDPAPQPNPLIRPRPRPAPRVAPTPVAPPAPDVVVADQSQDAVAPDSQSDQPREAQEATAEEEATTETVTEADEPASAPLASLRPRARPTRPSAPESQPETQTPAAPAEDDIAQALAAALAAPDRAPAASGPPLSGGEREGLRVAVSKCWNVGSLSTDALGTTVVVGVEMTQEARPVIASIRLVGSAGGSTAAAQQAFEAARRAIIRCGVSGFDLPPEKYDQWRQIEMTFNPEQMRTR